MEIRVPTPQGVNRQAGAKRCSDRPVQTGRQAHGAPPAPPAANGETEGPGKGRFVDGGLAGEWA